MNRQVYHSQVKSFLLLAIVCISFFAQPALTNNGLFERFTKQNKEVLASQMEYYKKAVDHIQSYMESFQTPSGHGSSYYFDKDHNSFFAAAACDMCFVGMQTVDSLLRNSMVQYLMESFLSFAAGGILGYDVIWGFFDTSAVPVMNGLTGFLLSPDFFCEEVLLICENREFQQLDPNDYVRNMIKGKPTHIQNDEYVNDLYKEINTNASNRKTLKVMHFTDLHIDLEYTVGAAINCNGILCCRKEAGFPVESHNQAPAYGSYWCDIPMELLYRMGDYVKEEINPDVIFWTGDVPPHDQWNYSEESIKNYQQHLTDFMVANFSQYAVHVIEGNHDFVVPNSQDFSKPDPIIDFNLKIWDRYFDDNAKQIYKDQGYYSTKLRTSDGQVHEKVNIVALNTEVCYHFNYFLFATRDDPAGELTWLEKILSEFEAKGEIAIILGHVPPGDGDCLYNWALRYRSIADRFQHIIRFSVYGHVHNEQYGTVRSFMTDKPVGVQYWTGSLSTFTERNPSFRVFEVDAETMLPVKIHTHVFNLRNENPKWEWDHEQTEYYGMEDLSPASFDNLSNRILKDEQVAIKFQNTKGNGGPNSQIEVCDTQCRKDIYCEQRNSVYFDKKDCMGEKKLDISNDFLNTLVELMGDPWYRKGK